MYVCAFHGSLHPSPRAEAPSSLWSLQSPSCPVPTLRHQLTYTPDSFSDPRLYADRDVAFFKVRHWLHWTY